MGALSIRLLGPPEVVVDGTPRPAPRGAKPWAVLGYLAATARAHTRSELASLLFGRADDPLGALRWTLAELRRVLDVGDALRGDPVTLELPEGASLDIDEVTHPHPHSTETLEDPGEFLADLSFPDSPAFDTWLMTQRRRYRNLVASRMRDGALARLGVGDLAGAADVAARLVAVDELDEGHHALLIRALAMQGDLPAAHEHFERCRSILEDEVGVEPGPAVTAALRAAPSGPEPGDPASREQIRARVAVAWRSFLAGAVDHGIDLARGDVRLADRSGDRHLRILTRTTIGTMLGMTTRGWDEAAAGLNEGLVLARGAGLDTEAATIRGILGGNEMMRADYDAARNHLADGIASSAAAPARTVTMTFVAAVEADQGDLDAASDHASQAVAHAAECSDPVRRFYAHCHAARIRIGSGDLDRAARRVDDALAIEAGAMPAIRPWALTMRAELLTADGRPGDGLRVAERALATSTVTGIAWQQGLARRAIGLAHAERGDVGRALDELERALGVARRTSGEGYAYHWPVALVLESLSALTSDGPASGNRWSEALLEHTAPIGMDGFAARARARLAGGGRRGG